MNKAQRHAVLILFSVAIGALIAVAQVMVNCVLDSSSEACVWGKSMLFLSAPLYAVVLGVPLYLVVLLVMKLRSKKVARTDA